MVSRLYFQMYTQAELYNIAGKAQKCFLRNIKTSMIELKSKIRLDLDEIKESSALSELLDKTQNALKIQTKFERISKEHVCNVLRENGITNIGTHINLEQLLNIRVPTITFLFKDLYYIQREFSDLYFKDDIINALPCRTLLSEYGTFLNLCASSIIINLFFK